MEWDESVSFWDESASSWDKVWAEPISEWGHDHATLLLDADVIDPSFSQILSADAMEIPATHAMETDQELSTVLDAIVYVERPTTRRKKKARTLRERDWGPHVDKVIELHITEKRPLSEVKQIMEREFGFSAELRQYRSRLSQWKFDKNVKSHEMKSIVRKQQNRKLIEKDKNKLTYRVRKVDVPPRKIERWMNNHGVSAEALYAPSPDATTPSDFSYQTVFEPGSPVSATLDRRFDLRTTEHHHVSNRENRNGPRFPLASDPCDLLVEILNAMVQYRRIFPSLQGSIRAMEATITTTPEGQEVDQGTTSLYEAQSFEMEEMFERWQVNWAELGLMPKEVIYFIVDRNFVQLSSVKRHITGVHVFKEVIEEQSDYELNDLTYLFSVLVPVCRHDDYTDFLDGLRYIGYRRGVQPPGDNIFGVSCETTDM
ncbi:hypothetical protein T440DRAFT_464227 [Plenodomus tracheiphilus IPT5]|uniref:Clr5 domain-containing protein n=1 Tax=Plenodomus tracheiphilus IPT5 TaxID=1408161 RepID=A0A6A7BK90_9PLEO|nr:hypothetical protein T440DRAFT_464227 [Plenodomus tracheiphilus IPT5]